VRWRILRLRSCGPTSFVAPPTWASGQCCRFSFVESDNLGALNMYSTAPDAFTEDDETVGLLRAAHAGIAMQGSRTESNLCAAIVSRDVIVQAKGILMERYKMDHLPRSYAGEGFTTHQPQVFPIGEELASTGKLRTNHP